MFSTPFKISFIKGAKTGSPLVLSATIFGIIFGFTGAKGGLSIFLVSSMSYIIFAGSAQFIALVLLIEGNKLSAILIAAIIINLRHLLYGAVLNGILVGKKIKRALIAYFLTDEAFLVTMVIHKEQEKLEIKDPNIIPDYILLGSGFFLWASWNIATILGYYLYMITSNLINLSNNFIIAASFIGFFAEQWKYKNDRWLIIILSLLSFIFGFLFSSTTIIISIMILGSILATVHKYYSNREGVKD